MNAITQVKLTKVEGQPILKALASVLVSDIMWVNGWKVLQGRSGLYVQNPSRQTLSQEYEDTAYPATKQAREEVHKLILDAYEGTVVIPEVTLNGIEWNGPAGIVSLIDAWRINNPHGIGDPEVEQLHKLAMKTVFYMRQLRGSSPKPWGDFSREYDAKEKG